MIKELRAADPESIGRYRLLGRLGTGGMGLVYLARSPGGRLVAIKVIRPELAEEHGFRSRFASEIAVARNVSGAYTAAVIDADPDAELPWLATAYVPGPSLGEAVDVGGPLPPESVLSLAAGLAEALEVIHAAGVVHRDLKPSNVLLAADGPRVIDFGISRAWERSRLTTAGVVMGSPGFLSPEQATGTEVGTPSDVFSLGAVLAFAATGNSPFGGGPTPALLYRVVNQPPDLSQVPARLRPLIGSCLAKDPASRPSPVRLLAMLSDEVGVLTGDWLPKTLADALPRYVPTIATPAGQALAAAEEPDTPPPEAPLPAIAAGPPSGHAPSGVWPSVTPDMPVARAVANAAAAGAADATHDIHDPAATPGPKPRPGKAVPVVPHRRFRRRWPIAAGVAAAAAAAVAGLILARSPALTKATTGTSPSTHPATTHQSATALPSAAATIHGGGKQAIITLTALQNCWVDFNSPAGKSLYQGVIQAGHSMTWDEKSPVSMVIGNPRGIVLTVDGKTVPLNTVNVVTLSINPFSGTPAKVE